MHGLLCMGHSVVEKVEGGVAWVEMLFSYAGRRRSEGRCLMAAATTSPKHDLASVQQLHDGSSSTTHQSRHHRETQKDDA
eukprot:1156120-Pelagomonas_calceolata.AAC.4